MVIWSLPANDWERHHWNVSRSAFFPALPSPHIHRATVARGRCTSLWYCLSFGVFLSFLYPFHSFFLIPLRLLLIVSPMDNLRSSSVFLIPLPIGNARGEGFGWGCSIRSTISPPSFILPSLYCAIQWSWSKAKMVVIPYVISIPNRHHFPTWHYSITFPIVPHLFPYCN